VVGWYKKRGVGVGGGVRSQQYPNTSLHIKNCTKKSFLLTTTHESKIMHNIRVTQKYHASNLLSQSQAAKAKLTTKSFPMLKTQEPIWWGTTHMKEFDKVYPAQNLKKCWSLYLPSAIPTWKYPKFGENLSYQAMCKGHHTWTNHGIDHVTSPL